MSEAIAKLKYAYEHSQMISSPEMREELGRQFDKLITEVQADVWREAMDAVDDAPELWPGGPLAEPANPYQADS